MGYATTTMKSYGGLALRPQKAARKVFQTALIRAKRVLYDA